MDNRFNELSVANQSLISALINTVASSSHVPPVQMAVLLADALNAVREASREAMTLEDVQ